MADPTDYTQLPNGTWIRDADNTGPYVRTAWDTFVLASTSSGGGGSGGLTDAELRASPVAVTVAAGTLTDRSGTITTGGTAQQIMASNASRKGFSVQNVSSGDLWVRETGTAAAAQPSLKLTSGAYFETPAGYGSTGAVSVFGATTGQAFVAREW